MLLSAVALAGCGLLDDPTPKPPVAPTPTPPSAIQSDEQTTDAVKIRSAYRRSFNELNRLEIAGGVSRPTVVLKETSSGSHLRNYMKVLRADKKAGVRQIGRGRLVGMSVGAGKVTRRPVTACEDYSNVHWLKNDGSKLAVKGPIRYLQHAVALKKDGERWKIDSVITEKVRDFSTSVCGGGGR